MKFLARKVLKNPPFRVVGDTRYCVWRCSDILDWTLDSGSKGCNVLTPNLSGYLLLIDDVFIINDAFYVTRYKEKYCTYNKQDEFKSIFLSAKNKSHHEKIVPAKTCPMNEAFHMHTRLMLVYDKGLFIIGLGLISLWMSIIWQSEVHNFLLGSYHEMLDMMKCHLLTINHYSNFV